MDEQKALVGHLIGQGRHSKALAIVQSLLESDPEDLQLRYWLAECLYFTDHDSEAKAVLTSLLSKKPDDIDCLFLLFRIHQYHNELAEAEQVILLLIKLRPEHADFYSMYASVMLTSFNYSKARLLINEAARLNPALSPHIRLMQCMVQVIDGKTKGAIESISQLLREEPEDIVYLQQLARVLLSKRKHRAALVIYESLVRLDPKSDFYHSMVIELRALTHWTALPLWPIYRFRAVGSVSIWLASIVVILTLPFIQILWIPYAVTIYLAYVVYSWTHLPLMRKLLS